MQKARDFYAFVIIATTTLHVTAQSNRIESNRIEWKRNETKRKGSNQMESN